METQAIREVVISYGAELERASGAPIGNSKHAAHLFRPLIGKRLQETFAVALLDSKNRPIGYAITGIGSTSSCPVDVGACFRAAIAIGSNRIIVSHNHPSGDTSASPQDLDLTRQLNDAAKLLGIRLLDHVIVGPYPGHTSIRDAGLWPSA